MIIIIINLYTKIKIRSSALLFHTLKVMDNEVIGIYSLYDCCCRTTYGGEDVDASISTDKGSATETTAQREACGG